MGKDVKMQRRSHSVKTPYDFVIKITFIAHGFVGNQGSFQFEARTLFLVTGNVGAYYRASLELRRKVMLAALKQSKRA